MTPAGKGIATVGVFGMVAVSAFASLLVGMSGGTRSTAYAATTGCSVLVQGGAAPLALTPDQAANARAIIDVGQTDGVPDTGWVIALSAALQESSLHNLTGGDRDSAGLFQQRPSQGWGTLADVTDVEYASLAFYGGPNRPTDDTNPGLLDVTGWQKMTVTQAAQAVERSAFHDAYAQWETEAWSIVAAITGSTSCTTLPPLTLPDGSVGAFLGWAATVIGDPYVWGATGPTTFDCSGLVYWSWAQAGFPMADRTAAQMWADATPVPAGQEQPGDLLFSEFGTRVAGPGHVAIIVNPGVAIEAPHTGAVVREFTYTIHGDQQVGRLSGAAFTGGTT